MIDTSAQTSCVTLAWVKDVSESMNIRSHIDKKTTTVRYASGAVSVNDILHMSICLPTRSIAEKVLVNWQFLVLNDIHKSRIIIGMDLLNYLGLVHQDDHGLYMYIPPDINNDPHIESDSSQNVDDDIQDNMNLYIMPEEVSETDQQVKREKLTREIEKILISSDIPQSLKDKIHDTIVEFMDVCDPVLHKEGAKLPHFIIKLKENAQAVRDKPRALPPNVLKARIWS